MEILALIDEMKRIRNESAEEVRKLESLIEQLNQRYNFYGKQATEINGFSELADSTRDCIRPLVEALHKSYETVEVTEKMIAKLVLLLPLVPPTF